MKLRFSPRAAQDLTDIADYIRERSPSGAKRVRAAIFLAMNNLVLFPNVGRQQTAHDIRKLVVRPYGYLVYYTLVDELDEIRIVTIRHPAREREHDDA